MAVAPWLRTSLTIGFVGAYTTFSTLSLETYRMIEGRAYMMAAANGLGSLTLGLIAVYSASSPEGRCEMKIEGEGQLLRIFVGESDTWHGHPLYEAIVKRVREEGLAGATVIRGIEGFGATSRLHTSRILRLSEDLPVVIEIVDTAERIELVLPILDEMVAEGMVTLEKAHIIAYRGTPPGE